MTQRRLNSVWDIDDIRTKFEIALDFHKKNQQQLKEIDSRNLIGQANHLVNGIQYQFVIPIEKGLAIISTMTQIGFESLPEFIASRWMNEIYQLSTKIGDCND